MIHRARAGVLVGISMLVVMSTTFAGASLAQTSPTPAATSGGPTTFTYADISEPSGLNTLDGYLGTDYTLWAMNYDLPINYGMNNFLPDYQHSIVTGVTTSSDSMTFTYTMRAGMKWSDGQPFTAKDVAWTLNFYKKYNASNFSADLALMAQNGAKAIDDTHFTITSTSPTLAFSGKTVWLYEYILPEHIWSKYENDYKAAKAVTNVPSVGSGPFIITKYVHGQYVELDKNPYYWGNSVGLTPHVDRVIYRIYGNQDAEAAALANGAIDFGYFTSANTLNTLKARGLSTRGAIVPAFDEVGINTGSSFQTDPTGGFKPHGDGAHALTDPIVREAMRRAMDSNLLISKVLQGYGQPAISPVLNDAATGPWTPGPSAPDLSFNIAAANSMLDAAGYKLQNPSAAPGDGNLRVDPTNNKPLEFRMYSRTSDQYSQDIVPYISAWFLQIGIKLDPQTLTSNKLGTVILEGNYDLFAWGWFPNPDPNYILNIFTCAQRPPNANVYRNSDSYYCNPAYDTLFHQQLTATDQATRIGYVHQMQDILYRDQPYLILWRPATLEAWNPKWTGFVSQPAGPTGDILATYGPLSFISLREASGSPGGGGSSGGSSSSGVSTGLIIAIVAGVIVILGGIMLLRKRNEEDEA